MGEVLMSGIVARAVVPKPTVPPGYTKLAYIQSSGTQYIDTGFKPNQDTRIVLDADIALKTSTFTALYGSRDSAKVNGFTSFVSADGKIQSDYGTTQATTTNSAVTITSGRHLFDKNQNVMSVDGTVAHTSTYETFSGTYPMYLLGSNQGGALHNGEQLFVGRTYSCKIYDNGTLVREYVPCMDPEGNVGLYDRVGESFYKNAGTGVFVGSEV